MSKEDQKSAETIELLLATVSALESRLEALEARPVADATATPALPPQPQEVMSEAAFLNPQSGVGMPMQADTQGRYEKMLADRASLSQRDPKYVKPASKLSNSQLVQRLKEFEAQAIGSARIRLSDMKTRGQISDFRILPPGSTRPTDHQDTRVLLTVDSYGIVVSADLG